MTETEPTYSYVPGQGWVVRVSNNYEQFKHREDGDIYPSVCKNWHHFPGNTKVQPGDIIPFTSFVILVVAPGRGVEISEDYVSEEVSIHEGPWSGVRRPR